MASSSGFTSPGRSSQASVTRGEEPAEYCKRLDRLSDEYRFGVEAYRLGWPMTACMFESHSQLEAIRTARRRWMTGWLDERSRWLHRDIWERWDIKF